MSKVRGGMRDKRPDRLKGEERQGPFVIRKEETRGRKRKGQQVFEPRSSESRVEFTVEEVLREGLTEGVNKILLLQWGVLC